MANSESQDSAWAQIKYEQKITRSCESNMMSKWEEVNKNRDATTVTLYQILHGNKLDKAQNLLYAPQVPRNFAAANENAKHPEWYRLLVEPGLHDPDCYPKPTIKSALSPNQKQGDDPDIHHMLEIRNGFVKRASAQDVEYLRLLHDLVHKVEAVERCKLEELKSLAPEDSDDDDDSGQDSRNTSGIVELEAIAPIRHVLFEGLYCTEHLRQQWSNVKAKSGPHHGYILIQKLEEVAGLRLNGERLTVKVGSGERVEDEPFAASSIVHPRPHLATDECCTTDYFVEVWEVTEIATYYINTRRSDPASDADVLDVTQRLSNVWHQDLSLLYKKGSYPFFQDLEEQNALQVATNMKSIHSRVPNFCSLAVLPLWHNIPYLYVRLTEAHDPPNVEVEDLCQHLHIAYDDIPANMNDGGQQMEDADD